MHLPDLELSEIPEQNGAQAKSRGPVSTHEKIMLVLRHRQRRYIAMIDWLSVKHQVDEFHRRHGGECYDDGSGHLIYPDGAVRSVDGALYEPPATQDADQKEFDTASRWLTFLKLKLSAGARAFDALHEKLTFYQPNNEKAALKELEELRSIVVARQGAVRKAQTVVDATSIGKARKDTANRPAMETAKTANWRAKLHSVRV